MPNRLKLTHMKHSLLGRLNCVFSMLCAPGRGGWRRPFDSLTLRYKWELAVFMNRRQRPGLHAGKDSSEHVADSGCLLEGRCRQDGQRKCSASVRAYQQLTCIEVLTEDKLGNAGGSNVSIPLTAKKSCLRQLSRTSTGHVK